MVWQHSGYSLLRFGQKTLLGLGKDHDLGKSDHLKFGVGKITTLKIRQPLSSWQQWIPRQS